MKIRDLISNADL